MGAKVGVAVLGVAFKMPDDRGAGVKRGGTTVKVWDTTLQPIAAKENINSKLFKRRILVITYQG